MKPWVIFLIVFLLSVLVSIAIYFSVIVSRFYKFVQEMEIANNSVDKFGNVESENDKSVDVVYTWVDSRDENWLKLKNKYSNKNIKFDDRDERWTKTKRPYDEILLSIKSVRKYLPWINNIFVIAHRPQTLPNWILNDYNVKMVYHDEIFPKGSVLPTFNSVAIETNLHRIPGLSEKFIYFNDDMYVNNYLRERDFFRSGKPIFRYNKGYSMKLILKMPVKISTHTKQLYNTINLLKNKFLSPIHQATPLTKTIVKNTEKRFPVAWNKARNMRFRQSDTVVPIYLVVNNASQENDMRVLIIDKVRNVFIDGNIYNIKNHDLVCVNNIDPTDFSILSDKIMN